MTKCVLALVILLQLCSSVTSNIMLNGEIIQALENLHKLFIGKKVNITSQNTIPVPSPEMHENASSCVGVFVRELKHLLNNVTVHEDNQNILLQLEANLKALGPHQENDQDCRMIQKKSNRPFRPYASFLRRLNTSKKG